MARDGKQRLAVDIPIELHQELKSIAKKYNMNLSAYLMMVLIARLRQESEWHNKKYV